MSARRGADVPDDSNPEWTGEDFSRAKRVGELPKSLQTKLRRGRPPLAEPKKQITLRLSACVLKEFRDTGPGWQTRIDEALKEWLAQRDRGQVREG